jgi:hypothetical protein
MGRRIPKALDWSAKAGLFFGLCCGILAGVQDTFDYAVQYGDGIPIWLAALCGGVVGASGGFALGWTAQRN